MSSAVRYGPHPCTGLRVDVSAIQAPMPSGRLEVLLPPEVWNEMASAQIPRSKSQQHVKVKCIDSSSSKIARTRWSSCNLQA